MTDVNSGTTPPAWPAGATGTWKLDPAGTTVELRTKAMWGLAKVRGTFKAVSGEGTVSEDGAVSGTLVIDATSIDTKNKKRDTHLRSNDFFDADNHPTFSYTATAATPSDGKIVVSGSLTVGGRSQPLDVLATLTNVASGRATLTAEAEIDRRKWGLTWAKMGAGFINQVTVVAQFTQA
jgi:polyisoprenoid-binding protein YceI